MPIFKNKLLKLSNSLAFMPRKPIDIGKSPSDIISRQKYLPTKEIFLPKLGASEGDRDPMSIGSWNKCDDLYYLLF
jgi:hypothetical protein